MYRIIPCLHGVGIPLTEKATRDFRDARSSQGLSDVLLLPGGLDFDVLKPWEDIIFPRSITIDDQDLQNLDCGNPENFCFTHYGPEHQDKPTNQDFALSGSLQGKAGELTKFCVLTDGISNGFGFSQRGAQLSCFAAYECIKELHAEFDGSGQKLTEADVDAFRNDLARKLNEFLQADHDHLISYFDTQNLEPVSIASKVWHKNFKSKPEKWYGNTLVLSFLSPFGGFVVFAGDGGIVLLKGSQEPKNVMRSDESSVISRFVTLGVTGSKFQGALIGIDKNDDFVEIITATDGVDRTYQLNNLSFENAFTENSDLSSLIDQVSNLSDRVSGEVDIDNYSIGRIFLSLSGDAHNRMTASSDRPSPRPLPKPITNDVGGEKDSEPTVYAVAADEVLKKKDRSMKIALTPLLLGIAIGLGVSNALIIGIAKMNDDKSSEEVASISQIAAAEAAALIAAQKANGLMTLEVSSQELLQRLASLTKVSDTAATELETAQAEATAAEEAAKTANDNLASLTEVSDTAATELETAQAEATAAEEALETATAEARAEAETAARIAMQAISN